MSNVDNRANIATLEQYKSLMSMILKTEDRLKMSDLVCISLDIIIMLFTVNLVLDLTHRINYHMTYIDFAMIFLCISAGMFVSLYWVAFAMRTQLKLKLRYFQARSIERRLGDQGEGIFADENIFFDPEIRRLESRDGKETLAYPTEGLTRMDGLVGSLKPRHFSWLLPFMFVVIYWSIFILVVTRI